MPNNTQYVPLLIVAKDSKGNFIHMREAEKGETYYCPCCGGEIKVRAVNSQRIQRHYYHSNGACSNESIAHWIYKEWLFDKGSQFYVDDILYEVKSIDIEQSHETKFGKYIPDITVYTMSGEKLFFEINYSNKKDASYADKWGDLDAKVVEVDVKKLLLADYNNEIPTFSFIYTDGQYTVLHEKRKSRDLYANTVGEYKGTISKDVSRFARLDDLWIQTTKYRHNMAVLNDVMESFNSLNEDDKVWALGFVKRIKCIDLHENFKEQMHSDFIGKLYVSNVAREIKSIFPDFEIRMWQPKRKKYVFQGHAELPLNENFVFYHDTFSCTIENDDGIILSKDLPKVEKILKELNAPKVERMIICCRKVLKNPNLKLCQNGTDSFTVDFYASLRNESLAEKIGTTNCSDHFYTFDYTKIMLEYFKAYDEEIEKVNKECFYYMIKNSNLATKVEAYLKSLYQEDISVTISLDEFRIFYDKILAISFNMYDKEYYNSSKTLKDIYEYIVKTSCFKIDSLMTQHTILSNINIQINSCKNNFWESRILKHFDYYCFYVKVKNTDLCEYITIYPSYTQEKIETEITSHMNSIIKGNWWRNETVRVMIPKEVG